MPKPYTCDLCGETDDTVEIYCGGYSAYHHPKCGEIGNKAIEKYLRRLAGSPRGLEWLVNAFNRTYQSIESKGERPNE